MAKKELLFKDHEKKIGQPNDIISLDEHQPFVERLQIQVSFYVFMYLYNYESLD